MHELSQIHNNIFNNIPFLHVSDPFRSVIRENIRRYCIKQLHNNTCSVVYVDLLVNIRVVICYTGSSRLRQRVYDIEMCTVDTSVSSTVI